MGAHAAGRAQPGAQPPDVPRLLPPRARRDHADLLLLPRARGAAGGDGGGLRRPDALHVQPGRRPQGGPARGLALAGRRCRSPPCAAGCPTWRACSSATRSCTPGPAVSACSPPRPSRRTASRGRSPARPGVDMDLRRDEPYLAYAGLFEPGGPGRVVTRTRGRLPGAASRCCWSRPTSASTSPSTASRCWRRCRRGRSTSSCPRCCACPRARSTPRRRTRSASTATTWSRAGTRRRGGSSCARRRSTTSRCWARCCPGNLIADMVAILGSMFFVVGDIDK